jgi:CIC family chloride channel protein
MIREKWKSLKIPRLRDLINSKQRFLLVDTVFLGVIGALSAQLFNFLLKICQTVLLKGIAGYQAPGLPNEGGSLQQIIGVHGLWLIPLVTTLGGLLSGFIVYTWAPEAEGHGTDAAVKSFHQAGGFIRARVPGLKMIASAITIGSGGAAGREGPTALISAGIGSIYATLTHRTDASRRLLVLIGMAAGLSAIFRSPIGTAFFAIEVLYGGMEFEAGALLYTMIGSVVAYAVNGLFVGFQPLFIVPPTLSPGFADYIWYILLGIVSGLIATLLPVVFYGLRDAFRAIHIPDLFKPAIGGLGVGLLGLFLPQILGGGYGWIQEAINGQLVIGLLLLLALGKILALSLTISSGGSGGVFGPSLFIGGALGGFLAGVFHQPAAPFVVVGMAAVFGGAARVPIATLLMVTEMTGDYSLLVPAALAVMLSYMVESALSKPFKYKSLYEAQVLGRADSPVHRTEQVEAFVRMLNNQHINPPPGLYFNLENLLQLGIPINLTKDAQFKLVNIAVDSPLINQDVQSCCLGDNPAEEIMAIFRGDQVLDREHASKFQAGDRVLMIASRVKNKAKDSSLVPENDHR